MFQLVFFNQFGNWYHIFGSYKLGSGSHLFAKLSFANSFVVSLSRTDSCKTQHLSMSSLLFNNRYQVRVRNYWHAHPGVRKVEKLYTPNSKSKSHVSAGWRGSLRTSFEEQQQFLATVLYWCELFLFFNFDNWLFLLLLLFKLNQLFSSDYLINYFTC